jgi:hypothetical protein
MVRCHWLHLPLLSTSRVALCAQAPRGTVHRWRRARTVGGDCLLPPPSLCHFSTTCNFETISSPLSSSAGVIDPRHLLQCYGVLLHEHFGRLHDKLYSFMGPLKGGSILLMLTSLVTHALSALPLGSFHSALGGGVTGAGAGPRGQCRLAACPGVPQGALPVSGVPCGSDLP